jgi:hypothetical protein
MAPMVATVDEARDFAAACRAAGIARAGIMIETPAAALLAAEMLAVVDFVSLGTNDLTSTRWPRTACRRRSALNDPWPARAAPHRNGGRGGRRGQARGCLRWRSRGDPALAPVLIGLGVTSLSMTARSLARVSAKLRTVTAETAGGPRRRRSDRPPPSARRRHRRAGLRPREHSARNGGDRGDGAICALRAPGQPSVEREHEPVAVHRHRDVRQGRRRPRPGVCRGPGADADHAHPAARAACIPAPESSKTMQSAGSTPSRVAPIGNLRSGLEALTCSAVTDRRHRSAAPAHAHEPVVGRGDDRMREGREGLQERGGARIDDVRPRLRSRRRASGFSARFSSCGRSGSMIAMLWMP